MFPSRRCRKILIAFLPLFIVSASLPSISERTSAAAKSAFSDVNPNFASEAIERLARLGLLGGTGAGRFEPLRPVTRAEFVAMADRMLGLRAVDSALPAFSDVPRAAWHYGWVQAGVSVGIAEGSSPRTFEPNRRVTRQEAAVLLARALKQVSSGSSGEGNEPFGDRDDIASWAKPSVLRLSGLGILQGSADGLFLPNDPLTRQEAAVLLDRALRGWSSAFSAAQPATIQLGWQYGQTTEQFEKQVAGSAVNTLSPRWFFLSESGNLSDSADKSLVGRAHARGNKVWAMVGNRSNRELTHRVLSAPSQRGALVAALGDAVKRYGLDGINVDFENVGPGDRDAFTSFVRELALELHGRGATLSVNVSPDLGTDWTEAFDYAALGRAADYVVLMAYDEHWGGSPVAGSVSSLPWLRYGLEKLLKDVPAERTIVALPFYTRDWYAGPAGMQSSEWSLIEQNRVLAWAGARLRWDDALGQYVADYRKDGAERRVWAEDGRSLARKALLARGYGVAGNAYWYMGGESADVWDGLRNAFRYGSYDFR